MSVLKNLESKIADAVEGTFSRVFRSEVRPVEIARKLAREMEQHRSESLSRTYVPNEYRVYLSPRDRDHFADYEEVLAAELGSYLLEHARREHFTLLSSPLIEFETDARLGLGQFGIQTGIVQPRSAPAPDRGEAGKTMIYSSSSRVRSDLQEGAIVRQQRALLLYAGRRIVVGPEGVTIGRSRDCDVVLDDPNASRHHAELTARGSSWVLRDLGSTNGTRINGRRLDRPEVIGAGDEIGIGSAAIGFELE